jgi:glycosyltransferase involved in cell wall biosynthesis
MGRIAILLPDLRGGGAERVSVDLAKALKMQGHDVELVLMQARGELLEEAQASFSIVDLVTTRARALPLALARYLRRRRPAVLLAAMWPLTVIAPVAARLSGHHCTVVLSEHNTLSVQYRDWGRLHQGMMRASMALAYRLADRRVGVSAGVVEDITRMSGLQLSAFDVVHNPVPPRSSPASAAIKAAEALWDGPPGARIVTIGSMKAQKNHPLLLRAFAKLKQPDARLMFVGDGKGRDALLLLANKLGVADRVILAGFHTDPTPFYLTADVFALSSDYEGFGNVIVEAMACGTPVVSTDCPSGPAEILENGRWGLLTPVGDAQALAETMNNALNTTWDAERLRKRAADFAPAVAARKYLNLFESP